jgi:hypothetical protein
MEYIYEARNMLSSDFCKEIIEKFENAPDKKPGEVGSGQVFPIYKKTIDLLVYTKPEWKMINDQLERCLFSGIKEYFEYLLINVFNGDDHYILKKMFGDNITITNFQIQRYKVGDHFGWHVDDKIGDKRLIAFIIYLNDNESGTEFINGKNIKPECGKILFFPSTWTYPHRGQEVKKGIKYIITGFICECI